MRCDVWWAETAAYAPWQVELLSGEERERQERYSFDADKARFTVGAVLLRLVAGSALGRPPGAVRVWRTCASCQRPHGRPSLGAGAPWVSVSHSGGRVVVAMCREAPVGVDLEQSERRIDYLALTPHVLSPEEAAAAPDAEAFVRFWVRKEALVKATGDGLGAGMRNVTVTPPGEPPRLLGYKSRPGLHAALQDLAGRPGYQACVAVLTREPLEVAEHDAGPLLRRARQRQGYRDTAR